MRYLLGLCRGIRLRVPSRGPSFLPLNRKNEPFWLLAVKDDEWRMQGSALPKKENPKP